MDNIINTLETSLLKKITTSHNKDQNFRITKIKHFHNRISQINMLIQSKRRKSSQRSQLQMAAPRRLSTFRHLFVYLQSFPFCANATHFGGVKSTTRHFNYVAARNLACL